MAIDDRSLLPSEVVSLSTPASPSRWRRFKNWSASQWAAIRPGPEARRGPVWGTLTAAAITVIIGGLYISTGFGYLFDFAFCILFAALIVPLIALIVALLLELFRKLPTPPVSRFASIPPPFKEKFTKLAIIDDEGYNQDWEVVFQTVRAPLSGFQPAGNSKGFDPSKLRIVRLKFDRTPMYKIYVSSIGFGKE